MIRASHDKAHATLPRWSFVFFILLVLSRSVDIYGRRQRGNKKPPKHEHEKMRAIPATMPPRNIDAAACPCGVHPAPLVLVRGRLFV